ncbi:MAG: hypothetical protein QOD57_746 [Actinomycetota bacterium]|jgi:hypothetical protein|nr:hypothetical protein [Actinomycetota bacterium]MDQ1503019.1 hypothetical protein [Actinomycetota bacterium]
MATASARLTNRHRGLSRPAAPPAPARVATDGEKVARGVGAVSILGVGLIHLLDVVGKFHETAYLGVLYVALMAGCVVAARHLVLVGDRRSWLLAGGLAGATLLAYALSRTVGLPAATDDIGNWAEPLGLASLFVEGVVVALSAEMLARLRPSA